MRTGIIFDVKPADRARLEAIVAAGSSPQKHVWRARIILMSGDGFGTVAIIQETGKSKTCVWRWQERFMSEGVDGLLRDKGRPSGIAPLDDELVEKVVCPHFGAARAGGDTLDSTRHGQNGRDRGVFRR